MGLRARSRMGADSLKIDSLADLERFKVGAACIVFCASGGHANQETILQTDLGESDRTLDVENITNFPGSGTLVVESELITYTGTRLYNWTIYHKYMHSW